MKVLILSNFGMGLYKFRKELITDLIENQYKVYISFPEDEYSEKLIDLGCKFIHSNVDRRGKNIVKDLEQFISYIDLLKKVKPDIVLTYTVKPNIYGGFACRIMKTPYISNITGLGTAVEDGGILKNILLYLHKRALRNAKSVFFQNNTNLNYFLEKNIVFNDQASLLPGSGVNLDYFKFENYPHKNQPMKFLFIGRVMKNKGIEEYLTAAEYIKGIYPNTEFEIVGFCEEKYEPLLARLEKRGIIKYHGKQNDVRPFIKESYAIVLPSYHEGLSNVLLESAALGRPILASKIPGCQETFDEGISGFGFYSRDSDSLIKALIKFIEIPHDEKIKMGYKGRKKIEQNFNRKIVVTKYSAVIKDTKEKIYELI